MSFFTLVLSLRARPLMTLMLSWYCWGICCSTKELVNSLLTLLLGVRVPLRCATLGERSGVSASTQLSLSAQLMDLMLRMSQRLLRVACCLGSRRGSPTSRFSVSFRSCSQLLRNADSPVEANSQSSLVGFRRQMFSFSQREASSLPKEMNLAPRGVVTGLMAFSMSGTSVMAQNSRVMGERALRSRSAMSSFSRTLLERRRLNWLSYCRQLKRISEVSFWLMRFYQEREQSQSRYSVSVRLWLCLVMVKQSQRGRLISETIWRTELILKASCGSQWQKSLEETISSSDPTGDRQATQTAPSSLQANTSTWSNRTHPPTSLTDTSKYSPRHRYTSHPSTHSQKYLQAPPSTSSVRMSVTKALSTMGKRESASVTDRCPQPSSWRNSSRSLLMREGGRGRWQGWGGGGRRRRRRGLSRISYILPRYFSQSVCSASKMSLSSWKQKTLSCACGESGRTRTVRSSSSRFSSKKGGRRTARGRRAARPSWCPQSQGRNSLCLRFSRASLRSIIFQNKAYRKREGCIRSHTTSNPNFVISEQLLAIRNFPNENTGFSGLWIPKSNFRPFPRFPNPSFLPPAELSQIPVMRLSLIHSTTFSRQSLPLRRYCTGETILEVRCRCWTLSPMRCRTCSPTRNPSNHRLSPVMGDRRCASCHSIPVVLCTLDSHSTFRSFFGLQFLSLLRSNSLGPTCSSLGGLGVRADCGRGREGRGAGRVGSGREASMAGRWMDLLSCSVSTDSSANLRLSTMFSLRSDCTILSFSLRSSLSSVLILAQFSSLQSMCHTPPPFLASSVSSFVGFAIFRTFVLSVTTQLCRFSSFLSCSSLYFSSSLMFLRVSSSSSSSDRSLSLWVPMRSELFLRSMLCRANPFICWILSYFSSLPRSPSISFSSAFTWFYNSTHRSSWNSFTSSRRPFTSAFTRSIQAQRRFISAFSRLRRYSSGGSRGVGSGGGGSSFLARMSVSLSVSALIWVRSCSFSCSYLQSIFLRPSSCLQLSSSSSSPFWQNSPYFPIISCNSKPNNNLAPSMPLPPAYLTTALISLQDAPFDPYS